jgi:hypothetical protein
MWHGMGAEASDSQTRAEADGVVVLGAFPIPAARLLSGLSSADAYRK